MKKIKKEKLLQNQKPYSKLPECSYCKKIKNNMGQLYFLTDSMDLGFCSTKCINTYYQPIIDHFEKKANEYKLKHKDEDNAVQMTLKEFDYARLNPHEIWYFKNIINEEYFTLISKFEHQKKSFYTICITFFFNNAPSFIFLELATENLKILEKYRRGENITFLSDDLCLNPDQPHSLLNKDQILYLGKKKSKLFAQILKYRSMDDIAPAKFSDYTSLQYKTLTHPDEVFQRKDHDEDFIYTYIKSFKIKNTCLTYYCICFHHYYNDKKTTIPLISFPSTQKLQYSIFKKGKKIMGELKC